MEIVKKNILPAVTLCIIVFLLFLSCNKANKIDETYKKDNKTWHTRDSMMIEAYKKIGRIKKEEEAK